MRKLRYVVAEVICFLLFSVHAFAQEKENRILILLDGSSSMQENWAANQSRFKIASNIILRLMDSIYNINDQVEFGLRVYGHQYPAQDNNCYDSKQEVMFSKKNYTQMSLRLESLHPYGISPIAYSLKEAAENDLINTLHYNYSIILISDGGESCNSNICAVAKELLAKKINFKPYIIGLVDYAPLKEQYACLGNYLQTTKEADIPITIDTIMATYRRFIPIVITPKQSQKKSIKPSTPSPVRIKNNIDQMPIKQCRNMMVIYEILTPNKLEIKKPEKNLGEGYVKFIGQITELFLSKWTNNQFQFSTIIKSNEIKKNGRYQLPAGKYKIIYNKKNSQFGTEVFREFNVQKNMITEIQL